MHCTPTKEGFIRLQGITFLYKGCSKELVAAPLNVTVRAVQRWIKAINESGINGVLGSKRTGRSRKIDASVFAAKYKDEFLTSSNTARCFHGKLVKKGEKLSNPFYKLHLRSSVIGAANPDTGEFLSHVVPRVDSEIFQYYLDEFNKVTEGSKLAGNKIVIVLDNARWHSNKLNWGHVEPLFLPPYSPDLNPIEQLWKLVKERFFNGWYAKNTQELDDRVCEAMLHLIQNPDQVRQTASMDYLRK